MVNEKTEKKFEIRLFDAEDVEEVANLFASSFCEREPTSVFLGYQAKEFCDTIAKPAALKCANEQVSFVCEDTSLPKGERIVGFRLAATMELNGNYYKGDHIVLTLLDELNKNWIESHPEFERVEDYKNKILYLVAVGIKQGYEGFGIASKLINVTLNNAKSRGYEIAVVSASAVGTQHIFTSKLGFERKNSIVFNDYEFNGKKVFKGLENPKEFIVLEKYLKEWKYIPVPEYKPLTVE